MHTLGAFFVFARTSLARSLLALALAGCAEGAALTTIPGDNGDDARTTGVGGTASESGTPSANDGEAVDSSGMGGAGAGGARPDAGSTGTGGSVTGADSGSSGSGGGGGTGTGGGGMGGGTSIDASARDTGVADTSPGPDGARGDGAADAPAPRDAAADVLAVDAGTVGLEAYWRFDEGVGTNAADSSGRQRPATLMGGAQWTTGRVGSFALSLAGGTQFAQTTTAVVNTSRPYSVTAWVQLSVVDANYRTAVGIDGTMVSAFFLQFRPDSATPGFAFAALPSDAPAAATAIARARTSPLANTWYHVAGVFDGANVKLYLNGALQDTQPYATPWIATGSTSIGRSRYSGANADPWQGFIDDVHIFSRALSDAEIGLLAQ